MNPASPQRAGDQAGVQGDAGAEHGPAGHARHDEHLGVGIALEHFGQVRGDVTVPVAHVVRDARGGHRIHRVRKGHEHGVGVRDGELVGERPAPVAAADAEPVHRDGRDVRAVPGAPPPAGGTAPAVDLERHDDPLAGPHARDLFSDRQDLGYAFVSEPKGEGERRGTERQRPVQVARGHGHRVDDRCLRARRRRGRDGPPREPAPGRRHEGAHAGTRGPQPFPSALGRRRDQPPQPDAGVALQRDATGEHGPGRQQAGHVPRPAARPVAGGPGGVAARAAMVVGHDPTSDPMWARLSEPTVAHEWTAGGRSPWWCGGSARLHVSRGGRFDGDPQRWELRQETLRLHLEERLVAREPGEAVPAEAREPDPRGQ